MSEPTAQYLRHRDVRDWIEPLGLEMKDFYKLTKSGVIAAVKLAQCKRAYYLKSQVVRHLIQPFRDAEEREGTAAIAEHADGRAPFRAIKTNNTKNRP